jgi:hypothetical protein
MQSSIGRSGRRRKIFIEKIEEIIRFHVQMMLTRFEEYHVMTHEWIHLSEPHLSNFINLRRNYVQRLEAIVDAGNKKQRDEACDSLT